MFFYKVMAFVAISGVYPASVCVIVSRSVSDRVASAVRSYNHRMYTLSIKSDSNTQKGIAFIEPCLFVCVIVLSTPSALTTFVV